MDFRSYLTYDGLIHDLSNLLRDILILTTVADSQNGYQPSSRPGTA